MSWPVFQPSAVKAPTYQSFTSGSGTYTLPTGASWIRVRVLGGGGSGGTPAADGDAGGNSTFGSLQANGGNAGSGGPIGAGGGSATGGDINSTGGSGGTTTGLTFGGQGGGSYFGSGGGGGRGTTAASAGVAYGSGGGGGGSTTTDARSGGGSGGYCEKIFSDAALTPTFAYSVGAGGASKAGNGSTYGASGAGSAGIIIVEEYYG